LGGHGEPPLQKISIVPVMLSLPALNLFQGLSIYPGNATIHSRSEGVPPATSVDVSVGAAPCGCPLAQTVNLDIARLIKMVNSNS
jgi:hypothetical protein